MSSDGRRRPGPIVIGLLAGVVAASAAAISRYDALTRPNGPPVLWLPFLLGLTWVIVSGLASGLIAYYAWEQRQNNAPVADLLVRTVSEALAEAIIGDGLLRYDALDRFKFIALDAIARIMRPSTDPKRTIRVVLFEPSQGDRIPSHTGKPLPVNARYDAGSPFWKAARHFLEQSEAQTFLTSEHPPPGEWAHLMFPDPDSDRPSYVLRHKIGTEDRWLALLCIDAWDMGRHTEEQLRTVLSIARYLCAALVLQSLLGKRVR
jgi:hypothetical protein